MDNFENQSHIFSRPPRVVTVKKTHTTFVRGNNRSNVNKAILIDVIGGRALWERTMQVTFMLSTGPALCPFSLAALFLNGDR